MEACLRHARRCGETFTVLCMDLDGFKDVNDRLGHAAGDEVPCAVAGRLKQVVRLRDTVARLGGDEFAIVMGRGGRDAANALAQRIARNVEKPIPLSSGGTAQVCICVGMASDTGAISSASEMLVLADQVLYLAKNASAS